MLGDMCLIYIGVFVLGRAVKYTLICKEVTNVNFVSITYCFAWKKYSPIIEWE